MIDPEKERTISTDTLPKGITFEEYFANALPSKEEIIDAFQALYERFKKE